MPIQPDLDELLGLWMLRSVETIQYLPLHAISRALENRRDRSPSRKAPLDEAIALREMARTKRRQPFPADALPWWSGECGTVIMRNGEHLTGMIVAASDGATIDAKQRLKVKASEIAFIDDVPVQSPCAIFTSEGLRNLLGNGSQILEDLDGKRVVVERWPCGSGQGEVCARIRDQERIELSATCKDDAHEDLLRCADVGVCYVALLDDQYRRVQTFNSWTRSFSFQVELALDGDGFNQPISITLVQYDEGGPETHRYNVGAFTGRSQFYLPHVLRPDRKHTQRLALYATPSGFGPHLTEAAPVQLGQWYFSVD